MSKSDYNRRRYIRQRRYIIDKIMVGIIIVLLIALVILGGLAIVKLLKMKSWGASTTSAAVEQTSALEGTSEEQATTADPDGEKIASLIAQADLLAAGYDYDAAIALLKDQTEYSSNQQIADAIAGYETTKSTLVRVNPQEITHVFFHILIVDAAKAFDGDSKSGGYNQMMTTTGEFLKMMQSMYDRGYVLVRIHDVAYETTDENGNKKFKYGDIMLPEGKKAFVLSQDDVCYYEYMENDGFATRMVIGDDGYPTCEMAMDDGSTATGDYDLVPILENFIKEHPDFSYKGARGIIAFTGYNGILGYRTDASYSDSPTYESDRKEAAKVAQCLRDRGWELASHSWGHRDMGNIPMDHFTTDTEKWEKNVESLIGPTDIILYPFGSDIGSWKPYTNDNERFTYLKSKGFRYFCNVDASNKYWMQLGEDHFRQGRRDLDGYRMYYYPDSMSDLFNTADVFDPARPTPVPEM